MNILKYLWQLPQNIVGCIYKEIFATEFVHYTEDYEVYSHDFKGYITLGRYIFAPYNLTSQIIQHETGHVKQSIILGPLYLLVIGLPSIIHAALHKYICKDKNYRHFYTEKWADNLAGLK